MGKVTFAPSTNVATENELTEEKKQDDSIPSDSGDEDVGPLFEVAHPAGRSRRRRHRNKKSSRLSFRNRKKTSEFVSHDEVPPVELEREDDPVVKLFEARNTQRVRFALELTQVKTHPTSTPESEEADGLHHTENVTPTPGLAIKKFIRGALFGSSRNKDVVDAEVRRELESVKREMIWESASTPAGPEVLRTRSGVLTATFTEDQETRAKVIKLLNKARRAQYVHYRYEYAVKCYVRAVDILSQAQYPDDHPVVRRTLDALNQAHHSLSSYKNSANIVKMGIRYEDSMELVRALKMYTIAYRIRRDNLSPTHPSLVVLLNMLGSVQIKRGELEEARQIFELALKDDYPELGGPSATFDSQMEELPAPVPRNLLARSVTFRDMGVIHEQWGETELALSMYHKSLDCLAEYKQIGSRPYARSGAKPKDQTQATTDDSPLYSESSVSFASEASATCTAKATGGDDGMEVLMGRDSSGSDGSPQQSKKGNNGASNDQASTFQASSDYDNFFPPELDEVIWDRKKGQSSSPSSPSNKGSGSESSSRRGDFADLDIALTLHQIGQLHRMQGEFNLALSAFLVSLRGMRYCVGKNHPNVASILGNIGNLQKEMGELDGAFSTYQQVLGIESYRLGLSHPDVAVTLHNIATIDAARGNHEHSLALYRQVIALQRKLFGANHVAVAVTSACMGDVYERVGDTKAAVHCFEEAARIKTIAMGRHALEVARLLHKLGKLAIVQDEYHLADSYVSRALLIYRLNKLSEQDEWMVDAARDGADIDAAIAMGKGISFEC